MKNKVILLLLVFICAYTYAQKPVLSKDFSFSISNKYKQIKNLTSYYVANGKRMIAIKKGRTDMTIQRFKLDDMAEDVKRRQVIEDKGVFQTVMNLGNKAIVFYTVKNKAYGQKISLTGVIAEKPIMVGSDKETIASDFGYNSTYGHDAGGRINQFVYKKSPDNTKLLVLFRIKGFGDEADKIGINIYDSALELLWKRKVTLPYSSKRMLNEDFAIDNNGDFYMTTSIFGPNADKKNKQKSSYTTEVYKIKEDPKDIIQSTITIPGKSITDAVIGLGATGRMRVTGYYTNDDNKIEISGLFSASIDNEGKVTEVINSDISQEIIQKYALERETRINEGTQSKKDEKDFEKIRVNNVFYSDDGGFVLFGEQRYAESFTTSSSAGSRTTYKYYYRNIMAVKLDGQGKIVWFHKLPKYQMGSRGKKSMSYYAFKNAGKFYLFHIDDFKNLKRAFEETPSKYYDGKKEFLYLTSFTIDEASGEVIKEPILTGSDIRNTRLDNLEVYKAVVLPNKEMIFEATDGKKNNLLLKVSLGAK